MRRSRCRSSSMRSKRSTMSRRSIRTRCLKVRIEDRGARIEGHRVKPKSLRLREAPTTGGKSLPQSSVLNPQSAQGRIRVLGIDPGLRITGFGVLDKTGSKLVYVTSGCIKTPAAGNLALRLKSILEGLREVIASVAPDQIAIEKVFVNTNPQSTLLLGQARGTAICAAVLHELPVAEYTALQVKQAVVGN